ncbi:hypothetical protein HYT55_00845 [Candidatus Woesearchaeota archaeon]|nr:hypothetical protein [Candidatus Woesearchaeota archaeon]
MNKRGITTIMALSLVVVFLFVAGIYVYAAYFKPPVEEAECGETIGWKIMTIDNKEDICFDQKTKIIRFTVENGLLYSLEGVYAKVQGQKKEVITYLSEAKTGKAGAVVGEISFDQDTAGALMNVQLLPIVVVDDVEVACTDAALEKQQLEPCKFYFY